MANAKNTGADKASKKRRYNPWTDEMNERLTKLFPTASKEELLKAFPNRNWGALVMQASRLGVTRARTAGAARDQGPDAEKPAKPAKAEKTLRDKLVEFLSRARSDKEIVSKFDKDGLGELAGIAKNPPEGYRFLEGHNPFQEKTSYLERIVGSEAIKVGKRVFEIRHSENDPDYLAVIFPPELEFSDDPSESALRIFSIDSSYWGDHLGDQKLLLKFLQYLEAKPYAFAFLLGNNIGGSSYTKETAVEIREDFKRHLAPVAHKILFAHSGPLEARMARVDGVEPLHAISQELGIYHSDRPIMMDVYWKQAAKPIEWYCLHGQSQARKDGAKLNAIIDIAVTNNFPHYTVLGNLNEGIVNTLTARRLDPVEFAVKEYSAITVVCSGFKKYEGSLAEKKGYPPPATGTTVGIIGADGSHKASS